MDDIKDKMKSVIDNMLLELESHRFMFDNFKLRYELDFIECITNNDCAYYKNKLEYKIRFVVFTDVYHEKRRREVLLHAYDFILSNDRPPPINMLKELVFQWDYAKIINHFNTETYFH